MFESEGISNAIKIMLKMIGNTSIRERMMTVQYAFGKYSNDYLGFGLFSYQKQ
jgi:hypothetical protein